MYDDKADEHPADAPTVDVGAKASPSAPAAAAREIGGFRILGKLGEGGMGIVYEAEQQNPRRRVALKVIRGGQHVDEVSLRMFRREAETLARLAHPNIAAIYEAGRTDDGLHFFTMELVAGRTLSAFARERLGGERPSSEQVRERLRLFTTICHAVNYAHQRGVIHRDLKPSNVVATESGDVKVLDFGLARITDTDVAAATVASELGAVKGTLPYMSPEQARGDTRDIDLRTDVYSLGVILYELLAGRLPYDTSGDSIVKAIRTICEQPPRELRATSGGVAIDGDLQTIAAKALEKEPDRRYQSAGALAEDIERYLTNQPILAHPPSTMYQLKKLVSRHKGRVAALGAIGVLIVALMATMVVQSRRVRMERDRARAEGAKSEAINRFLLDALGAADPWSRGSRTVTLVEALHQAQGKAHAAFQDQPLIEASVLQTLGTTFGNLAVYAEADTALRAALGLRTRVAGRRSAEVVEALGSLASLYLRWERYTDAERYAREALDLARQVHGASSLYTAAATNNLATALSKLAKLPEATALAEEAMRIPRASRELEGEAVSGEADPVKLEAYAMSVLGEIALQQGDSKALERTGRDRLAIVRKRYGEHSADAAAALNQVGTGQMLSGDLPGAERSFQEAIDIARSALGDGHPDVALFTENLGNVFFRQGKLDQTAQTLEQVLAMRRKALGDESESVARTMANIATAYRKSGKLELSERTYREAIALLSRTLGPEHPDVGQSLIGLGDALRQQRKFADSETTLQRGLGVLRQAYGEAHPMTQRTLKFLADLYTDWSKPAQAAAYTARLTPAK